jgi:hypothetical protein
VATESAFWRTVQAMGRARRPVCDALRVSLGEFLHLPRRLDRRHGALDGLRQHKPHLDQVHGRREDIGDHLLAHEGLARTLAHLALQPPALHRNGQGREHPDAPQEQDGQPKGLEELHGRSRTHATDLVVCRPHMAALPMQRSTMFMAPARVRGTP